MFRLLFWLMLFSGAVFADSELKRLFSEGQYINSMQVLKSVQTQFPGMATELTVNIKSGDVIYQVGLVNLDENVFSVLDFDALNGQLLRKRTQDLTFVNTGKLQAVAKILERNQTFFDLLKIITQSYQGLLVNARLDRDLGINYLEVELLNADGITRLVFDIDQMKPLPLLTQELELIILSHPTLK